MTLKNSISALCPLACCLRRFKAKHKCLSVRQSLLIISAKRWHSQTAEGHTGLQALGWPRQEAAGRNLYLAVGASSRGWREGDGGADVGLGRSPPRGSAALPVSAGLSSTTDAVPVLSPQERRLVVCRLCVRALEHWASGLNFVLTLP